MRVTIRGSWPLSMIFRLNFGTGPTVQYILFFSLFQQLNKVEHNDKSIFQI